MNIAIAELEMESEYTHSKETHTASRCMAIIWARKLATENDKIVLAEVVRGINGVTHVDYSVRKPLILMVEYQNDNTSAFNIVSALRATEGNVLLIGC